MANCQSKQMANCQENKRANCLFFYVCLSPSSLFLIRRQTYSALVSAVVVFPFMLWANVSECWGAHSGGGAAMAYVVVFLFGVPAALFSGFLTLMVSKLLRR